MSAPTVVERVAAGAAWLDAAAERHPDLLAGWPLRINLRTFDLRNSCRCVLGQLAPHVMEADGWCEYGDWIDDSRPIGAPPLLPADLVLTGEQADGLGFNDEDDVVMFFLDAEWRDLIAARNASVVAPPGPTREGTSEVPPASGVPSSTGGDA